MKHLFISFLFLIAFTGAFAQFERGTWMVGASFSGVSEKQKMTQNGTTRNVGTLTSVEINPLVGYFVANHLAVGAGIDYKYSGTPEVEYPGTAVFKSINHAMAFTPFARYYVHHFYGQVLYRIGGGNSELTGSGITDPAKQKYSVSGWFPAIGYAWLLNRHVAIEPLVGFASITTSSKNPTTTFTTQGLFAQLGIQVYLRKSSE